MKISKAVGIDLGTTRSLIGVMDIEDKNVHLWRNEFGKATIPSVIQWDAENDCFKVGDDALLTWHKEPTPIRSIKRQMGYGVEIEHAGKTYKPEDVSAEILKFLKKCGYDLVKEKLQGQSSLEYVLDRGIITIPAYFDQPKIEATREAAKLAGIQTLELLFEPTAAAIYYCWKHKIRDGNFLVYDLGGGTFDVSVLRRIGGSFDVIGTAGDNVLGGDTFDMALAEYIIQSLNKAQYNMDLNIEQDPQDKARFDYFTYRAEGVKKKLSDEDVMLFADAACPLPDKDGNSLNVELKITRAKFENLIEPYITNSIQTCYEAIENAKKKAKGTFKGLEDIDYILLVGGSTWIPYVKETIRCKLCAKNGESGRAKAVDISQDAPDECVAIGAALLAASSGGVIFEDEEQKIRLHLDGASISADDEFKIKGRVEPHKAAKQGGDDSPFNGFTMSLSQDEDEVQEVVEINEHGRFMFEEIIVEADQASKITLTLRDLSEETLGVFSRTVGQGEDIDKGTAPINSHTIWIYTKNRKGEKVKNIIIENGESLPCEKTVPFATTEPDHVLLKIYQGDIEIKEALQSFETQQQPGTKMDFSISMDTQGDMVIRSIVGDLKPFVMELQPPPPPPPPTKDDAEKVFAEFESASQELQQGKRRSMEMRARRIKKDLNTALDRGDVAMANERMAELSRMTDEITDSAPQLHPPMEEFEDLVREVRDMISRASDKLPNADDLLKNVDAQMKKGQHAFRENDQQGWAECFNWLQGQKEYIQERLRKDKKSDKMPPLIFLVPALASQLISELQQLCTGCSDQVLLDEAERHIEILDAIPTLFASDDEARMHVSKIQAAVTFKKRMETAMGRKPTNGSDGIPSEL